MRDIHYLRQKVLLIDDIEFDVSCRIIHDHEDDVPYLKNGDPGYPGYDDIEVDKLDYVIKTEDVEDKPEYEDLIVNYLNDHMEEWLDE